MTTRRDQIIGVAWLVAVAAFVVAMAAALVQVVGGMTADMAYRWTMALFLLCGPLALITRYNQAALRRFFTR